MQDKNDIPNTDAETEQHVDQMMDPHVPDPAPVAADTPSAPLPPIDIFAELASAPEAQPAAAGQVVVPQAVPAAPEQQVPTESEASEAADPTTDKAVDDIVAHESDEVLAAQDAMINNAFANHRPTFADRLRAGYLRWWDNRLARYGTFVFILAAVGAAATVPTSRYYVLNTAGVRATASLTVLDGTTTMPLKNVHVTLGDQSGKTNGDGVVTLSHIKLGSQPLTIQQLGFATVNRSMTIALGANHLDDISLQVVGTQFRLDVSDYLSGKPVQTATVTSGDANARTDSTGKAMLTIGKLDDASLHVHVTAAGYRAEDVVIDITSHLPTPVSLVPDRKEVYVSKQSGKYDVYKSDIDGKNKQVLLSGSGNENDQITLSVQPGGGEAALVSTRDNNHNQDGYLLQTLSLIDVDSGQVLTLDHSEQIRLVDWIGDRLVYVKIKAGASAGTPDRYQLLSYDFTNQASLKLASANYFNDVVAVDGSIYYAASNSYNGGQSQFVRIDADNTNMKVVLGSEVWNVLRNSYDHLDLTTPAGWYTYTIASKSIAKSNAPADQSGTRFYLDNSSGKQSLWTDSRDGKGVLLTYDTTSNKDTTLVTQSGLTQPTRWLNDRTVIYRVVTPTETADYAVSLDGGTPKKIVDVTNTSGLGKWYY